MENQEMIAQGAEGRIYKCMFLGVPAVVKERFEKAYRHPTLDRKITRERLKEEARNIARVEKLGIDTATLYYVNLEKRVIVQEFIDGITMKVFVNSTDLLEYPTLHDMAREIGKALATLHDANIIHGDLTTSNMMIRESCKSKVTMIDFGLSFNSSMAEDRAVDLYVLERAFQSTHPNSQEIFDLIIDSYSEASKRGKETVKRLEEVRMRGRKRSMVG